jgi:hypothetical protein
VPLPPSNNRVRTLPTRPLTCGCPCSGLRTSALGARNTSRPFKRSHLRDPPVCHPVPFLRARSFFLFFCPRWAPSGFRGPGSGISPCERWTRARRGDGAWHCRDDGGDERSMVALPGPEGEVVPRARAPCPAAFPCRASRVPAARLHVTACAAAPAPHLAGTWVRGFKI